MFRFTIRDVLWLTVVVAVCLSGQSPAVLSEEPHETPQAVGEERPSASQREGTRFLNPANGHYYEYVETENITWTAANDAALKASYEGMCGYLVTITSECENAFLMKHWKHIKHAWIGASDSQVEGEWRWVTGPEKGTLFWKGQSGGSESGFASWREGEPNNSFPSSQDPPDEDYAVFNFYQEGWNDLPNDPKKTVFRPHAYIIEFSAKNHGPRQTTWMP